MSETTGTKGAPRAPVTLPHGPPAEDIGPGLGGFWRALPREGRFLLSTVALQHLGRGMVLPFLVIYLHEVRHFSLETSGSLIALVAVVAGVLGPPMGTLTDRWGGRVMLITGSVAQSLGALAMALATSVPTAAAAAILMGVSHSIGWSASNTFISALVRGPLRQRYFGVNFALLNLGIGAGGLLAGLFVDVARPVTFQAIFVVDAVLVLIPAIWLLGPLRHVHARAEHPGDLESPASYLAVLRLPAMRWILLLGLLSSFAGYGQMEAGVQAFARTVSQVDTSVVGYLFAANTAVIVLLQFAVLSRIEGHRRTRVMLLMLAVWSVSWLALGASGLVPGTLGASLLVVAFGAIFALGETLLQPSLPAMTNDLAPDHLRGRVNAASSTTFMLGGVLGPVVAGQLLGRSLPTVYIGVLLVMVVVAAAVVLHIERQVTPEVNGLS